MVKKKIKADFLKMSEKKEKILVSACLLGQYVRYDGKIKEVTPQIKELCDRYEVIPICPERDGGLPIPRPQNEIVGGKVMNILGKDVTKEFVKGAELALETAKKNNVKKAVLKQSSPSCGTKFVYNGKFEGVKINGMGITAKMLSENGIEVLGEDDLI